MTGQESLFHHVRLSRCALTGHRLFYVGDKSEEPYPGLIRGWNKECRCGKHRRYVGGARLTNEWLRTWL